MARERIRIRLKAYDHRLIDQSAQQIVEAAERTGAAVAGPVPLPTKIEKFTVNRSPFIDKDSREGFRDPHAQAVDRRAAPDIEDDQTLMRLDLPAWTSRSRYSEPRASRCSNRLLPEV